MEEWQKSLDKWLTSEQETPDSKCKCSKCLMMLYPDDEYYELEGDIYCEDCAEEWLESNKYRVTDNMAYD